MKSECLEIYKKTGTPQDPQKELLRGEQNLIPSYDASCNKFPKSVVTASSLDEIKQEKKLASLWKHEDIPVRRMYLWVLKDEKIFIAHEAIPVDSDRGFICHSNITAGEKAIIGGELWFLKEADGNIKVYINFDSGRYKTVDAVKQYPLVIDLFKCVGYTVDKLV